MLHKVPLLDALYEIPSEISYVLNRIQTCKHEVVINQNLTVYDIFNFMTDPDCYTVDDLKLYVGESCLSHIECYGDITYGDSWMETQCSQWLYNCSKTGTSTTSIHVFILF